MRRFGSRWGCVVLGVLFSSASTACGGDDGRGGSPFTTAPATLGTTVAATTAPDEDDTEDEDDAASSTGRQDAESSSSSAGSAASTITASATSTTDPTDPTDDTAVDPALQACLDIATDECQTCGCNLCLASLLACEMDPGCVAIRTCADVSGCTDELSCYNACQSVIEQHGGLRGVSLELVITVAECIEPNCPICLQ